jgi:hypothetical protein
LIKSDGLRKHVALTQKRNNKLFVRRCKQVTSICSESASKTVLKEILTGRCYSNPPVGGMEGFCPSVVRYLMGVLEGHLDEDIDAASFSAYFEGADFSPGDNGGMFWLRSSE